MFEKNLNIAFLLDFYGDVLSERKRAVLDAYYNDDLSLSEIASDEGISRQGIRHLIKKGEEMLEFYDAKLSLAERHGELSTVCESLEAIAERLDALPDGKGDAAELRRIIRIITKGS